MVDARFLLSRAAAIAVLCVSVEAAAQSVYLVKDICPGTVGSNPSRLVDVNGTLFFTVTTCGASTVELWKSNGTAAGTTLLKQFKDVKTVYAWNNMALLEADDAVSGLELWKSDGTVLGTVLVKDIYAGATGSVPSSFASIPGAALFRATDVTSGAELWRTDGTTAGTTLVKDVSAGTPSSSPINLATVGGAVYFEASTPTTGYEVFLSDGTSGGTTLLKDINAGSLGSFPNQFTALGGNAYFSAFLSGGTFALWKSNGTTVGTTQVLAATPTALTPFGASLLLGVTTPTYGTELWKSDGTPAGTALVKDIDPGTVSSVPNAITVFGTMAVFVATTMANGTEVWKTDGTAAGTVLLKDINPGSASSVPFFFTNAGGLVYFRATDAAHGAELWKTDGTPAGTTLVQDIVVGTGSSLPTLLTSSGGRVYFNATNPAGGNELWAVTTSCAAGTHLCGSVCVSNNDVNTCGASCSPCPAGPASSTPSCDGSKCGYTCNAGLLDCGALCAPSCCVTNADCVTPPSGCFQKNGICSASQCSYAPNDGAPCDADGDKCTPHDVCASGECVADVSHQVSCVVVDCQLVGCNPVSGNCDYLPVDGTSCGGNGCFEPGTCTGGLCSGAPLQVCAAGTEACRSQLCEAESGLCKSTNLTNGTPCTLDDKCLVSAPACFAGQCTGDKKICPPSSSCRQASCSLATGDCDETSLPDGTPCASESCTGQGTCFGGECSCGDQGGDGGIKPPHGGGCSCELSRRSSSSSWPIVLCFSLMIGLRLELARRRKRRVQRVAGLSRRFPSRYTRLGR